MDCKYVTSLSHISRHIVNLTFTKFQSLRSLGISFWLECHRIRSFIIIVCYWITRLWKIKTISDYKNSVSQWLTEKQLRHSLLRINKYLQHNTQSIGMLTHFRELVLQFQDTPFQAEPLTQFLHPQTTMVTAEGFFFTHAHFLFLHPLAQPHVLQNFSGMIFSAFSG